MSEFFYLSWNIIVPATQAVLPDAMTSADPMTEMVLIPLARLIYMIVIIGAGVGFGWLIAHWWDQMNRRDK
jgi:hypothetical protein